MTNEQSGTQYVAADGGKQHAIDGVVEADSKVRAAEVMLAELKQERDLLAQRARSIGVSQYRIAAVTGRRSSTVEKWLKRTINPTEIGGEGT